MAVVRHKEAIHSGHFMISNFEAEEQDDEENIAVPVPEEGSNVELEITQGISTDEEAIVNNHFQPLVSFLNNSNIYTTNLIDVSLNKLFQCMSIAYRQKLTSPKWNRFRGMKLRWKDKIRLNNVIWRCWHNQFIKGHRKLVCAFANPLEIDNHNKTEAGAILEGKYWKRKLATVTAEYKRWRIFYKQQHESHLLTVQPFSSDHFMDATNTLYQYGTKDDVDLETMITDADFFVDALYNSLGNQQREYPRNADMMQPDLNYFHPNLDELMDLDPMAPLQDWLSTKLPEVENSNMSARGKSLTPEQDILSLPLMDIKDIDVLAAQCQPFNHHTDVKSPYNLPEHEGGRYRSLSTSAVGTSVVVMGSSTLTHKPTTKVDNNSVSLSQSLQGTRNGSQHALKNKTAPSSTFKGGKLWSAAVRQAQELELQAKSEYKYKTEDPGSSQQAFGPTQLVAGSGQLVSGNPPLIPGSGQLVPGSGQLVAGSGQLGPGPSQQVFLLPNHQLDTRKEMTLQHSQAGQLTSQQSPASYQQSVIRGTHRNKVGLINQDYQASDYVRRPDDCHDDEEERMSMNLKVPRLDVFANNTYSLNNGVSSVSVPILEKSRRVSAPGRFNLKASLNLQQSSNLQQQNLQLTSFHPQQMNLQPDQTSSNLQPRVIQSPPMQILAGSAGLGGTSTTLQLKTASGQLSATSAQQLGRSVLYRAAGSGGGVITTNQNQNIQNQWTNSEIGGMLGEGGQGIQRVALGGQEVPRGRQEVHRSMQDVQEIRRGDKTLVELLQENRNRPVIKTDPDDTLMPTNKRKWGKLVPPPPPGSMPQPAFTGCVTPNPGIPDDLKVSIAEQKRRCTIKYGFEYLRTLVPSLAANPNLKISKAALLVKGAEHIGQLKSEKDALAREIEDMRESVQALTSEITQFQSLLPSQGAAPSCVQNRSSQLENLFEQHVAACTMQNWKYWVFSKIMHPLLETFDKTVSSSSFDDLVRTSNSWLDQHASLVHLRPLVIDALKDLSINTDILTEPHRMPQEALNSITSLSIKSDNRHREGVDQKTSLSQYNLSN